MVISKLILLTNLFIIMGILSFAQKKTPAITIDELKQKMKSNADFLILDVRTPDELEGPLGKIEGIVNIPIQELEDRVDELEEYQGKEIAVICRSGNRSHYGTEFLNEQGYDAKNVLGGMMQYRKEEKDK